MTTFKELKCRSRQSLEGRYSFFALLTFLMAAVNMALSSILTYAFPSTDGFLNTVLYLACSLLVNVVFFLIQAGQHLIYLRLCRRESFRLGDLFFAFRERPEQLAIIGAIQFILETALSQLNSLLFRSLYHAETLAVLLLCSLGILALNLIVLAMIRLIFSMLLFLYCDDPWQSAGQLLKETFRLLHGNSLRLLLLDLSFIGMEFLSLLSFGLGSLFVQPYRYATFGWFYLDRRERSR